MHPEFTSFDFIGQAGSKADFLKKREEKVFSIVENGREAQGDIKDKFRQDLESVIKEGAMDKDFIESLIGHFQIDPQLVYKNYIGVDETGDFSYPVLNMRAIINALIPLEFVNNKSVSVEVREIDKFIVEQPVDFIITPSVVKAAKPVTGDVVGTKWTKEFNRKDGLEGLLEKNKIKTRKFFMNEEAQQQQKERGMLRVGNYFGYFLSDFGKLILVCDNQGEATFVLHKVEASQVERFMSLNKLRLQILIRAGLCVQVNWGDVAGWNAKILAEITRPNNEVFSDSGEEMLAAVEKADVKKQTHLTYAEAQELLQDFGYITTRREYEVLRKQIPSLPYHPEHVFASEWRGWDSFLSQVESFEDARSRVKAKGFRNSAEYRSYRKLHPEERLPTAPDVFYADQGWAGWNDFLGIEILDFVAARDLAGSVGFAGSQDYYERYMQYSGLPSNPNRSYRGNWVDWYDYLGKKNKK